MRRATTIAVLLAAVTTLGCGTGTALAAKKMEVTLQDDGAFLNRGYYDRERALGQAAGLGVTRLRVNVHWASSLTGDQAYKRKAPKKPTYDFSQYDSLITAAAAHGMRVDVTLVGDAPAFATKNHQVGIDAPKASAFAAFAKAAATHFKGKVTRYSIWNEPNLKLWLAPASSAPKVYRAMFSAAYKTIHKTDRKAHVLIGETAPYGQKHRTTAPLKFLRAMACVNAKYKRKKGCKPLVADGYAHHPYDFTHKPSYRYKGADNVTLGTIGRLTTALSKLDKAKALYTPKHKALGVYLTEFGYYHNVPAGCNDVEHRRSISQARQAKYTVQAFGIAQRNPHVRSMLQYLLVSPPETSASPCFATGLLLADGKATKAYTSLRSWVAKAAKKGRVARKPKRIALH